MDYLVSDEDDRDVLTDSGKILVPFWDVFVGDSGANIEHDDSTVTANIVSFSKTTQFFLASSIPKIEFDRATVGVEDNVANLDTLGGYRKEINSE